MGSMVSAVGLLSVIWAPSGLDLLVNICKRQLFSSSLNHIKQFFVKGKKPLRQEKGKTTFVLH